jgi:hypothetical protein
VATEAHEPVRAHSSDDRIRLVGVRLEGTKELVALTDGYRESPDSWSDLLRDLKRRGMRPPVIAVGDGALGFWAAPREVWASDAGTTRLGPQGRQHPRRPPQICATDAEKRCWPRSATPKTVITPPLRPRGSTPSEVPKAAAKISDDLDRLSTFYDFPAETGGT